MRAAGWFVLAAITSSAASARADWRDGCPAGDYGDHGTDGRLLAPSSELVSPIAPSRALVSWIASYYTQNELQADRQRVSTWLLQLRQNFGGLHFAATLPGGLQYGGDAPSAPRQFGNPLLSFGYTRYWKTDKVDSHDDPGDVVWGARYAWGVEAFARAPYLRDTVNDGTNLDDAQHLELLLPFEAYLFAPDAWDLSPWGVGLELRRESVGCYAPFVDVHFSAMLHGDAQLAHRTTLVAPQTITVGAYVDDNVALMLQYGIVVIYNADPEAQQLYVHRFRAAVEVEGKRVGFGGNLDLFQGSAHLDGTVLAIHLSMKWDKGR